MSYLTEMMGEGESVLFSSRQHGFVLFARLLAELILVVLLVAVAVVALEVWQPNGQYVAIGAAIVGVIVLLSILKDVVRWRNDQFVVTDRRVLQLKGVLNKNVLDSSLEKINDVQLEQSFFGRMFDYGTIEILTASEEAINRMVNIANPVEFKRAMQDARARYDGYIQQAPRQSQSGGGDIQSMLEQLAALRDRGILSQDEFEAKKRDVLSRI
jgi:uncharacterized membrane protein YdbT with pleckstrin-like domain